MHKTAKLPIGIEDFADIRTEGFYYVDKTGFIRDLLQNWGKVNLLTRPRRFGKSLNMSMLKYFFSYGCDGRLFDGLEIAGEAQLCEEYMGKFPVIFVSLKDVSARDYQAARDMLHSVIRREAMRFDFLLDSSRISEQEKALYRRLIQTDGMQLGGMARQEGDRSDGMQPGGMARQEGDRSDGMQPGGMARQGGYISDEALVSGLQLLCGLLHKHYGKKTILLIDEYDVPLEKAQQAGYYDDMVMLLRNLFSQALKTNESLYFAVLTGCFQIVKESIFTGLNNLNVMTITNVLFCEYFGLLDGEVREMLAYYGLEDKYGLMKEWYDGYRFGNADVYCPWDVINYIYLLRAEPDAFPKAFWLHTSGNDMLQRFLEKADQSIRYELELLVNGESISKKINQELTYRELYQTADHLWSVLFMSGYLTQRGRADGDTYELVIPNQEIRQIFVSSILNWFREESRKDAANVY